MAIISIRPSAERLRNLGSVASPQRTPHFISPDRMNANRSIVPGAVGNLAQTIQRAGGQVFAAYLGYKAHEKDILLAEAGAAYQEAMRDAFVGTDAAPGLLSRTGEDLHGIDKAAKDAQKKAFDEACGDRITGNLRRTFEMQTDSVRQSYDGLVARHIAVETAKQRREAATQNREAYHDDTWMFDMFNADATSDLLEHYKHERKEYGDTDELAHTNLKKYATGLAAEIALAKIAEFAKTDSDEAFAEYMRLLKEEPDGFWNDNEVLRAELGDKAFNPKTVEGLVTEAKRQRERYLREKEREENDAVKKVLNAGIVAAHTVRDENGNYPADRLAKVETALSDARDLAATMPKESSAAANAAKAASELDDQADRIEKIKAVVLKARDLAETMPKGSSAAANAAKYAATLDGVIDDMEHPDRFAAKSDAKAWVEVKQRIAEAERKNTSIDILEAAVEEIKYKLTAKDYFSLWSDVREKRDKDSDRIAYQVFSAFLGADEITEDTVALAADRGRRGSSASNSAISTLLGAGNAEYMRSGGWHNPDFTIEDIDEVMDLTKEYLAAHPGDRDGADKLLRDLVEPISRAARARTFRERIRAVRRHERMQGNAGTFSVQKAFAQEDEAK